jgi:hypothetical protein
LGVGDTLVEDDDFRGVPTAFEADRHPLGGAFRPFKRPGVHELPGAKMRSESPAIQMTLLFGNSFAMR